MKVNVEMNLIGKLRPTRAGDGLFFNLRPIIGSRKLLITLILLLTYYLLTNVSLTVSNKKSLAFQVDLPLSNNPTSKVSYYSFNQLYTGFGGHIDLARLGEISKIQLREKILKFFPPHLRRGLNPYITPTLKFCEKYQVDPLWALAIMWTESHFNPSAESFMKARGLMQIMPKTGEYLAYKMKNIKLNAREVAKLIKNPVSNIEMGIFYLRYLLKYFKGNYIHATVSYNMGPGRIKGRLRDGKPVGVRNLYLDKVRNAYKRTSLGVGKYLASNPPSYIGTLVVRNIPARKLSWAEKAFSLYPYGLPEDVAFSNLFKRKSNRSKVFQTTLL